MRTGQQRVIKLEAYEVSGSPVGDVDSTTIDSELY